MQWKTFSGEREELFSKEEIQQRCWGGKIIFRETHLNCAEIIAKFHGHKKTDGAHQDERPEFWARKKKLSLCLSAWMKWVDKITEAVIRGENNFCSQQTVLTEHTQMQNLVIWVFGLSWLKSITIPSSWQHSGNRIRSHKGSFREKQEAQRTISHSKSGFLASLCWQKARKNRLIPNPLSVRLS